MLPPKALLSQYSRHILHPEPFGSASLFLVTDLQDRGRIESK